MCARSARTILSEREGHDVTTKETHLHASGWHNPSVLACCFVPRCMEAFFEARFTIQDHKALGRDSFRGRP